MKIKSLCVGQLDTNCYLYLSDNEKTAVLIDPGFLSDELEQIIYEYKDKIKAILLTHMHFDHIMGLLQVKNIVNCPVYIHKYDAVDIKDGDKNCYNSFYSESISFDDYNADITVNDNDVLYFDGLVVKVIHTPGHTKGSVCYVIGDCLFTGDTLFKQSVGNPNFYGGNTKELIESIKKISALKEDYCIFPGHGEDTTLVYEKQFNPYVRSYGWN